MQDMQKLEEEVQRLQDENTAMKAQQKSLEFYVQDSRRYRWLRSQAPRDTLVCRREVHLDNYIDGIIGTKAKDFSNCTFEVGKPSVELPYQIK